MSIVSKLNETEQITKTIREITQRGDYIMFAGPKVDVWAGFGFINIWMKYTKIDRKGFIKNSQRKLYYEHS